MDYELKITDISSNTIKVETNYQGALTITHPLITLIRTTIKDQGYVVDYKKSYDKDTWLWAKFNTLGDNTTRYCYIHYDKKVERIFY